MRTKNMFKNNLIDEVVFLIEKYSLTKENQSMRSIGYRQVIDHLNDNVPLQDLENKCVYATRQLAKRQITWLKRFDESIAIDIADNDSGDIDKAIDNHLHFQ
jgi:tRNA dimethylallyltransferase